MKKLFAFLLWALICPQFALAQNPVITLPNKINSQTNASSTIAVTNTFQSVFAASTGDVGRTSCAIQNNGSNSMWVFFGPIADATKPKSVKLAVGQSVTCSVDNIVIRAQVSITGTATEEFYAAVQ